MSIAGAGGCPPGWRPAPSVGGDASRHEGIEMPRRDKTERKGPPRWLVMAALLGISVFMYASIMYKIIKFGP